MSTKKADRILADDLKSKYTYRDLQQAFNILVSDGFLTIPKLPVAAPPVNNPLKKPGPNAVAIIRECNAIRSMLLAKNQAYGDSALNPTRIFSKANSMEQIRVRIDDKLSRMQRGTDFEEEDTVADLIGYMILLRVAESIDPDNPEFLDRLTDEEVSDMSAELSGETDE